MTAYFPQRVFDPRRLRSADRALFVVGVQRKSLPLTYPPFELEPQMRGVRTMVVRETSVRSPQRTQPELREESEKKIARQTQMRN